MQLTEVGTRLFFTRPEREHRDTAKGAAASAVFHLLIILVLLVLTRAGVLLVNGDQGTGTGIGAGPAGGGGGGGRDQISLLIPTPSPQAPEEAQLTIPRKIEEIKPPETPNPQVPVVAKADSVPQPAVNASPLPPTGGSGTGEGTGTGPGTGTGTGPGSGGGSGGGQGGGVGSGVGPGTGKGMGPSPEVLLLPPTPPGSVKGKTVVVRLAVDSAGVVRDADLIPPTGDKKYDAALKRVAMGWHFRAARDPANRPVSVLFDVTFTF